MKQEMSILDTMFNGLMLLILIGMIVIVGFLVLILCSIVGYYMLLLLPLIAFMYVLGWFANQLGLRMD
jgi:hypothetical protein